MVKLILVVVLGSLFNLGSVLTNSNPNQNEPQKHLTGGVITMEDIILHIGLDDSKDKIKSVDIRTIEGNLIQQNQGCYAANCTYNVALLEAGIYQVTVFTTLGTFTQLVAK